MIYEEKDEILISSINLENIKSKEYFPVLAHFLIQLNENKNLCHKNEFKEYFF